MSTSRRSTVLTLLSEGGDDRSRLNVLKAESAEFEVEGGQMVLHTGRPNEVALVVLIGSASSTLAYGGEIPLSRRKNVDEVCLSTGEGNTEDLLWPGSHKLTLRRPTVQAASASCYTLKLAADDPARRSVAAPDRIRRWERPSIQTYVRQEAARVEDDVLPSSSLVGSSLVLDSIKVQGPESPRTGLEFRGTVEEGNRFAYQFVRELEAP